MTNNKEAETDHDPVQQAVTFSQH